MATMVTFVSVADVSRSIDALLNRAEGGETIVIIRPNGRGVRLMPCMAAELRERVCDEYRGRIRIHHDFDEALPTRIWLGVGI